MSAISAISAAAGSSPTAASDTTRIPQKTLGKNDFMQLLAVQFKMQDPMKPMDDTAFIAQTAQFTALEQATSMAEDMAALRADQQRVVANSYLGHHVTVDAGKGEIVSGDVTAVDNTGASPQLVVNGKPYSLSAVLRVEPGVVSASSLVPAGGA
jgi:flagellar basal-body rod modification protein FlgD